MKSSLNKFFSTYTRILKLAYQIHPGFLILITVINLAWGLTNLPVIYINKALVDLVVANIGNPNWQILAKTVMTLVAVRTVIELFRSILTRINMNVSRSMGRMMSNQIDIILGVKLNSLDVPTVDSADFQDQYAKLSRQANDRIWGMISTLQEIPNALSTIAAGVIPIWQFNPWFILLVFVAVVPDMFVSVKLSRLDYLEQEARNRFWRVLNWLHWVITDVRQFYENKISANINYLSDKSAVVQNELYESDARMRLRRIKWRTVDELPQFVISFVLNSYFFIIALAGKITIGTAQLLYQSATTLANGISTLMNNVATIYENYLFVKDYADFMDIQPKDLGGTKTLAPLLKEGIKFSHVWFKYPHSSRWVLKDVSLEIKPDENIALVGENGAGKTTLLKLLLGFYKPQKGSVVINGTNLQQYNLAKYWKRISALPQEYYLYPFSARESIAFSDLSRANDLKAIKKAAKLAQIDGYISKLPKGYDTPITKDLDGVEPSGGQKQRIAIARALFKKSQILILDEPTSNIDPKAEEQIFANVLKITKKQIVILVSHRFSTVRKADKIFLLENGSVTEQGTHTQLMQQNGNYAHLFNLQAKSYQ